MLPAFEGLDDEHAPAATRAWRTGVFRLHGRCLDGGWRDPEQFTGAFEMRLAGGAGEQAIVTDAVEALRQYVEQETADELVGGEGHDLLAVGAGAAIILVAERDAGLVEALKAAVRDGNAVDVAGQISQHGLGSGERRPFDELRRALA